MQWGIASAVLQCIFVYYNNLKSMSARLVSNDKAISFSLPDFLGSPVSLSDYKGKKILLVFFRVASCPFCNLRVRELITRHPDFERQDIQVIAVFASTREEIKSYAGKQLPPFPIIPDPQLDLYKKYRIEQSHAGMLRVMLKPLKMLEVMRSGFFNMNSVSEKPLIPAEFLIDPNQLIYRSYYGKDFGDHLPMEDILNWKSSTV
jgi:thioredoxin-dependent peroxiredoxin